MCMQIDMVGSELLNRLLGQWGLMHQLTILRNVFLLGCPLLVPFASSLFGKLHKGQKLLQMSQFELEIMLQHSLSEQSPDDRPGDDAIPNADALSGVAPQDNGIGADCLWAWHHGTDSMSNACGSWQH